MKNYYIYILSNRPYGVLYIGVTNDLIKRVWEHKEHVIEGFSKRYWTGMLVYYESCENILSAIAREKQIKKWNRQWKIELINKTNPHWKDLSVDLN